MMKGKNNPKIEGVSDGTNSGAKKSDLRNETEIKKKMVGVLKQEPTRLYYSSPCLLSEIEDDESILNL